MNMICTWYKNNEIFANSTCPGTVNAKLHSNGTLDIIPLNTGNQRLVEELQRHNKKMPSELSSVALLIDIDGMYVFEVNVTKYLVNT